MTSGAWARALRDTDSVAYLTRTGLEFGHGAVQHGAAERYFFRVAWRFAPQFLHPAVIDFLQ